MQLKVAGSNDVIALTEDPKNPTAFRETATKLGQTVIVRGVMMPAKNLKAPAPLQVSDVK